MKLSEQLRAWAVSPDDEPVYVPYQRLLAMAKDAERMEREVLRLHAALYGYEQPTETKAVVP